MTQNQLMTAGAIGFAGFALWYVLKRPGGAAIAAQPGQRDRDSGLFAWNDQLSQLENELWLSLRLSQDQLAATITGDTFAGTPLPANAYRL